MIRSLALVAVILVVGSAGAASGADDPLASLNRAIQERFQDVDTLFGLRRIVVLGDTPHQFRPESVNEFGAVQELKDQGLHVALYMAGRRVLEREPNLATKEPFAINRRVIFGPIAVTPVSALPALPREVELIDRSRAAFRALERRERYDFEMANWTFTARAIRAATDQCLTCHRDRKIGDALGVALYAYRSGGA